MALFNEVGGKIKLIARGLVYAVPVLTLIASVVSGVSGGRVWVCVLIGLAVFLSAWPLYGFGQLVQDIHDMRLGDGRINVRDEELPRL